MKSVGMQSTFTLQGATSIDTAPSETADKMATGNPNADASLSDGSQTSESLRYQDTHSNILGKSGIQSQIPQITYLSFDESDSENVYP
jgi:hypothetical protein